LGLESKKSGDESRISALIARAFAPSDIDVDDFDPCRKRHGEDNDPAERRIQRSRPSNCRMKPIVNR
jgi:hypothetical protein